MNDLSFHPGGWIAHRIEACETQPYHLAAQIQPHGVFIAVDPEGLRVRRVSANAEPLLGRAARLGQDLRACLTKASANQVMELARHAGAGRSSLRLSFSDPPGLDVETLIYHSSSLLCIEFELPETAASPDDGVSQPFFALFRSITHADVSNAALCGIVCDAIRGVTGFDRIYYCRFDEAGHGHVLGESRTGVLAELMDHHFPATDIPQAARRMFVHNPFRLIPDVDTAPVAILGDGSAPLDLTMSTCRAVAPSHLQYIRNMGVQASLSFPVTLDHHLAAIFGGHHATPRRLSWRQLMICQHIVELFKSRSEFLRLHEENVSLVQRIDALAALLDDFRVAAGDLGAFIEAHHAAFCALLDADDVICRFEGEARFGRSLTSQDAVDLLEFASGRLAGRAEIYQTDRLGKEDASLERLCPAVAGVVAVSLDLAGGNIIAWLKREAVVVEKWSGDPLSPAIPDGLGGFGPRTSFLAYLRQVKGTSRPWPAASLEFVRQLRAIFGQALVSRYEIRMRRAAEQSNALKSEFLANISHELRSPMHAIIGFADLLAAAPQDVPEQKRQRHVEAIRVSGKRLLHLINDLLDLSQLEAGKMGFCAAEGDVVDTVAAAVAEVSELARAKGVAIRIEDRRHERRAWFDAARIGQVMINLLANAVKFSPPGTCVTVSLMHVTAGPHGLTIETADQGIGIPAHEIVSVFDKFVQSSRTKHGGGGTGLGLSICREIIEAHGGRIWAANNAAGGCSFFIDLPPQVRQPA